MLENPGWNLGDPLPTGWIKVEFSDFPSVSEDETVYEEFPIEKDGVFYQNIKVRPLTPEEIEIRDFPKKIREKLNAAGLTDLEIQMIKDGLVR